jgi:vitamin B12 transporter
MKRASVFFISLFASALLGISTIAWAQQTSPSPTPVSTATASTSGAAAQTSQPKQPAAAASPTTPGRLPVLVVTATRLEQPITEIGTSVSVIEAPEMQAQKLVTVGDALREIPGVEITPEGSPGSLTGVQIRGGTSEQTLILVDGPLISTPSARPKHAPS